jgi:hypothetical protein
MTVTLVGLSLKTGANSLAHATHAARCKRAPIKRRTNAFLKHASHRCRGKNVKHDDKQRSRQNFGRGAEVPSFLSPDRKRHRQDNSRRKTESASIEQDYRQAKPRRAAGKLKPDAQARAADHRRQRCWRFVVVRS